MEKEEEASQRNEQRQAQGWRRLASKAGLLEATFTGFGPIMHHGDGCDSSIKGSGQVGIGLGIGHLPYFFINQGIG